MSVINNLPRGGGTNKYEIITGEYRLLNIGNLSESCCDLGFATDGDGNTVRAGGLGYALVSSVVEKIDKDSDVLFLVGRLSGAITGIGFATDGNGDTVRVGGKIANDKYSSVVEKIDKESNMITQIGLLSDKCDQMGLTANGYGDLIRAGGYSQFLAIGAQNVYSAVEKIDKDSNVITRIGSLSEACRNLGFAADGNGDIIRAGGNGVYAAGFATVEKIDKDNNIITKIGNLSESCGGFGFATDGNGDVVRAGGESKPMYYETVEKFNKDNSVRSLIGQLGERCSFLGFAADGNGDMARLGGSINSDSQGVKSVEKFDKDSMIKTVLPKLKSAKCRLGVARDGNGDIIASGGYTDRGIYYGGIEKLRTDQYGTVFLPGKSSAVGKIDFKKVLNNTNSEISLLYKVGDIVRIKLLGKKYEI